MTGGLPKVVVAGDVTVDWNLAVLTDRPDARFDALRDGIRASSVCGGAAILRNLIATACAGSAEVVGADPSHDEAHPRGGSHPKSYTVRRQFDKPKVWRVERFLGFDALAASSECPEDLLDSPADVVVLDDNGRQLHAEGSTLPVSLAKPGPWVVWKVSRVIRQSTLAKVLLEKHANRLITIVSIGDLRAAGLDISKGLSWEATAQGVVEQFTSHFGVSDLAQSKYLIVVVPKIGAILGARPDSQPVLDTTTGEFWLNYDPMHIESDSGRLEGGGTVGYVSCLTASIVYALISTGDQISPGERPPFDAAVRQGIGAMKTLYSHGYDEVRGGDSLSGLVFPFEQVAAAIQGAAHLPEVGVARIPALIGPRGGRSLPTSSATICSRPPPADGLTDIALASPARLNPPRTPNYPPTGTTSRSASSSSTVELALSKH